MPATKHHLPCNVELSQVQFPCLVFPKVDGIRGTNIKGELVSRQMRPFDNTFTTQRFSQEQFLGIDGELALGHPTDATLCARTDSVLSTRRGKAEVTWWAFDWLRPDVADLPYQQRLARLVEHVQTLALPYLRVMPYEIVETMDELLALEAKWLAEGYEGVVGRSLEGAHKDGRATMREGAFWRLKRFVDEEAEVLEVVEAVARKTGQGKGEVGVLICRRLSDGARVKVASGEMVKYDRIRFLREPELIVGRVITYKTFPKDGGRGRPRWPSFKAIRSDMPAPAPARPQQRPQASAPTSIQPQAPAPAPEARQEPVAQPQATAPAQAEPVRLYRREKVWLEPPVPDQLPTDAEGLRQHLRAAFEAARGERGQPRDGHLLAISDAKLALFAMGQEALFLAEQQRHQLLVKGLRVADETPALLPPPAPPAPQPEPAQAQASGWNWSGFWGRLQSALSR